MDSIRNADHGRTLQYSGCAEKYKPEAEHRFEKRRAPRRWCELLADLKIGQYKTKSKAGVRYAPRRLRASVRAAEELVGSASLARTKSRVPPPLPGKVAKI